MRAPFQALIIAYRIQIDRTEYLVCQRADDARWQAVSGGGEDDETPRQAACRELFEETHITCDETSLYALSSSTTIPAPHIAGFLWGPTQLVIPEHSFCVQLPLDARPALSSEHSAYRWADYEQARSLLAWDSNKTALWETNHRIIHNVWCR